MTMVVFPYSLRNRSEIHRWLPRLLLLASLIASSLGCARDQYLYGTKTNGLYQQIPVVGQASNPISVGGHHPRIDKIEQVVQAPRKFFRQNRSAQHQHAIPPELTEQQAVMTAEKFLVENGLPDVNIDVRRYEPAEQWQRLKQNDLVAPFWKYTFGTLDVLGYTLLPRRALRSDVYSPYTNTLSLNSQNPTRALYQSARVKEYRKHHWLGTYSALQRAPFADLTHHIGAASDALTYAQINHWSEMTDELYPRAYSEVATAVISDLLFFSDIFVPLPSDVAPVASPIAKIVGGTGGRMVGKYVADRESVTNEAPVFTPGTWF